jgi:uncharacterized coiled-coil DUF342 family protein
MRSQEIRREIQELTREIDGLESEINRNNTAIAELEQELRQLDKTGQDELAQAARQILEAADHRLGGNDLDALHSAIAQAELSTDQLWRINLLAREFLLVTL